MRQTGRNLLEPDVEHTQGQVFNRVPADPFRRHHEPGEPATAGARRAELVRILGIVVLAALMGLTSWVVASISTWLVPVYVTAMVLIFVFPQAPHLGEPEPAGEPAGVSADRASEATSPASSGADSPGATTLEGDGSPEASATGAKPPGSPTPKRRRTRGQGRKPVKPGPEPAVTTSPAAWIRIGPGKFVRADSQDQGYALAPVPHAPLEAAEASIEAKSAPPDLVEETNPNAVSTVVDVPNRADLNESGPSPEHETLSEEPAAIADPEPGSSVVALMPKADVGRQESDSTAAPATIAIDGDSPADSIDVGRQESDSTAAPATIAIDGDSPADSIDVGRQESDSTAAPATIAIDGDSPADSIDVGRQESDSTAAPATIAIDGDSPADSIDVGRQESDSTAAPATIAIDGDSPADSIDVGRQESDSTAAPATIAIDGDSPADSIDVGRQESDSTAAPATIAIDGDSPADSIDVGRQESDSTAAPAMIAIDGDSPADSIVAEPVTEEYGIAPSAFGPSLLEVSLEEDHEQGWTDLPDSTGTGTKTPVDAGNGNGNRCNWMWLKLRSGVQTASGCLPRLEKSRRLQNVRSGARGQGFAELGARQIAPHAPWFGETSAVLPELTAVINPAHHRRVPDRSPVPAPALPLTIEPAPAAGSTPLPAASQSASPSGSWYSWPDERMLAAGQNCPAVFATAKSSTSGGSVKQWRRMPGAFPPQELCCFFWRHGSHHIVGNGK